MNRKTQLIVTAIGAAALLAGALLYLWARPPGRVYLLDLLLPARNAASTTGVITGGLPSFLHIYAFTLFTAALLSLRPAAALIAGSIWFLVDALLELAQHPVAAQFLLPRIPAWFGRVPVLENVAPYLQRGTFDPLDILALALGVGAALLTLMTLRYGGNGHGTGTH